MRIGFAYVWFYKGKRAFLTVTISSKGTRHQKGVYWAALLA